MALKCTLSKKMRRKEAQQGESACDREMDPAQASRPTGTKTQEDQWMVEDKVGRIYAYFSSLPPSAQAVLLEIRRDNHIQYLTYGLLKLGPSFSVLDANRPWICYWILHSIAVLGDSVDAELESNIINFLSRCQDPEGGYGGGPGQMPHLATTYAAVNSLITLGIVRALSSINRGKLYAFMRRMKDTSGGFRMHDGGEVDVRACYTAISVASILNFLDEEMIEHVGDYILSCQTYEGGIAGEPGSEAHGGYTFCGLAAMILIGEVHRLDLPRLIDWLVFRQGVEGGFQGRTNKLVDGCYSFWQGGAAAILQILHSVIREQLGVTKDFDFQYNSESDHDSETSDTSDVEASTRSCHLGEEGHGSVYRPVSLARIGIDFINRRKAMRPIFSSMQLQQYLLLCSQEEAGFRDKPGKNRDHYHTCYCLSGLSICQYCSAVDAECPPLPRDVLGSYSNNLVEPVHPLYNVVLNRYLEAHEFFSKL